jgi:hypothetical protein
MSFPDRSTDRVLCHVADVGTESLKLPGGSSFVVKPCHDASYAIPVAVALDRTAVGGGRR